MLALAQPHRHALPLHHLHLPGLNGFAAGAGEVDGVPVEVGQVAGPGAEPGFSEAEHFFPEKVAAFAAEEGAVGAVGVFGAELGFFLAQDNDQVSGDPVRALVRLVLVCEALPFRHPFFHAQDVRGRLPHHPAAATHLARPPDRLALAPTLVAPHLHLLEDPRRKHVLLHHHAAAPAFAARIYLPVRAARALALLAYLLLLNLELVLGACVEIPQWHRHANFHVRSAALATAMARVATAAEEAAEKVERVVRAAGAVTLLVLLEAFVAVLVVDFAGFADGEGVVGFGDLDEFLGGGVVATGVRRIELAVY